MRYQNGRNAGGGVFNKIREYVFLLDKFANLFIVFVGKKNINKTAYVPA